MYIIRIRIDGWRDESTLIKIILFTFKNYYSYSKIIIKYLLKKAKQEKMSLFFFYFLVLKDKHFLFSTSH